MLRTPRIAVRALVLAFVLAPAGAYAAPRSRKPPPLPSVTSDPRHDAARHHAAAKRHEAAKPTAKATEKSAPRGLKNTNATSRSRRSTASHKAPAAAKRTTPSTSVGSPTEGKLVGGVRLPDGPHMRIYPVYAGSDVRWGTDTLVGLVDRAAKKVRKQFADAVLSVGHLSKAGGGELDRHASHESGRDADIGFYVKNASGKPIYGDHMVTFKGDGTSSSWPGAHFDDARNWALVAAIVGDGRAKVTHLFVATPIRQRLLAYATKIGASPMIRSRASEVLAQPRGSLPHDDHFHVRIACPSHAGKCIEHPLAKRHPRHGHPVASSRHPAAHGHGATAGQGSHKAAPAHAAAAAHAPVHGAAPSHGSSSPAARAADKPADPPSEETANSDSLVPSFAQSVPGLDSVVIPAPLVGVKSTWGTSKDPAPPAGGTPISDPDGVLDHP